MWTKSAAAVFLSLVWLVKAQVSRQCSGDVCYSLNIPEQTASSGVGDIYFQITGPTNNSWIGLGQGSSMTGSRLFVIYTSAAGNNVTVSPRLGTGHNLPRFDNETQITLLQGSGVKDGFMTANIRCSNCHRWSNGGTMDFKTSSATWVYAHASGTASGSDDPDKGIQFHGKSYGSFDWDFSAAKGGNTVNPFLSSAVTASGSNTTDQINKNRDASKRKRMLAAHGVLACLAFVIFFPVGAMSIRVLNFPSLVWLHAGMQIFAFFLYIVAFGLGIHLAKGTYANKAHPTIGKAVFVVLCLQPISGHFHHKFFRKHFRRCYWSYAHLWLGRFVITMGIVNGGLGLRLAGKSGSGPYVAYWIVAGVIWLLYLAFAVYGEVKRKQEPKTAQGEDLQGQENKPRTENTDVI